jgi:subtilisin-like proprotein convertase family protein
MKHFYCLSLITVFFCQAITSPDAAAQCGVSAKTSKINIICGDSVTLSAVPNGIKPLENDFNNGTIGAWAGTNGVTVTNGTGTFSCMGTTPDPPSYAFMGSSANTPRFIQSNPLDLTQGGAIGATACFYMKYSSQGQTGTCEGPDAVGEGVALEYSTNCGAATPTWTQVQYWDPNGGNDPQLTSWNQYCINLPPGVLTNATCFRWVQRNSSGVGFDTWAIDDVEIILNIPGYKFDWKHDNLIPAITPFTPKVAPDTTTTYTVTYSNKSSGGTDTCTSMVTVNVTRPQVTSLPISAICPGDSIQLTAISPYQAVAPTVCGLATPKQYCDPISEISNDFQIGNGTIVHSYNNGTDGDVFGDFGSTGRNSRMQIIYRAAELTAAGVKAGRLRSIAFNIALIEDAGTYTDFSIYMACTSQNSFPNNSSFVPFSSLSLVYGGTGKNQTLGTGWFPFTFDNDFYWDGTSNIVVQVCWTVASSGTRLAAKTMDHASGFNSVLQAVNNTSNYSPTVCQSATTFAYQDTDRPNTIFGNCYPRKVIMAYDWTPKTSITGDTTRIPVVYPPVTTSYVVTAYARPNSRCATKDTVLVDLVNVQASIAPASPVVCPPATPSVNLTASGTTTGLFSGPVTFESTSNNLTIANNTAAGVNSSIAVNGMNPATLGTNGIVKVCVNVTTGRDQDIVLKLTSPASTTVTIYNRNGTGANLTQTCFVTGAAAFGGAAPYRGNYAPANAFQTTGNVNGTWTLNASDVAAGGTGGVLNDWDITFNTGPSNDIVSYNWAPPTSLSSTTTPTPTASPTVTTTYSVTVTDAKGCTAVQSIAVGYCMTVPVNFSKELTVSREGVASILKWQTAQELNNGTFVVERSVDGLLFTEIGKVQGKGTTQDATDYMFPDHSPAKGFNYYRLRQVDLNGKAEYSNIAQIFYSATGQRLMLDNLLPVPVKERLSYTVIVPVGGELLVQVLSMDGKVLLSRSLEVEPGATTSEVEVSDLPGGIYMLKVSSPEGEVGIKRFSR